MAYVITENCTKDSLCVDVCPVNCIGPTADDPRFEEFDSLFVNPDDCIDCGACVPVCPTSAIMPLEEVPAEFAAAIARNAAFFKN